MTKKTSDDIWTEVYDNGCKNGVETLPFDLKQLWYYIDFTYYVDNGGPTGFLYNKSTTEDEFNNYFQPYIESWTFFGLLDLVRLVENYSDRYLEAAKDYNRNDKKDFDQYKMKFKVDEIVEELDPLIEKIVWTDKNQKVWNWLDENIDKLQRLIQTTYKC